MSEDTNIQTEIGHFAKYINIKGRRNHFTRTMSHGRQVTFEHNQWVRIPEDDVFWFEKTAKNNNFFEYKKEDVLIENTLSYVRFNGMGAKTVATIAQYDKDEFNEVILNTKRDYLFPKGIWILINSKDHSYFNKSAMTTEYFDLQVIKLPSTFVAPLKIESITPRVYEQDIYNDLQEKNAYVSNSLIADKVGSQKEIVVEKPKTTSKVQSKPKTIKRKKKVKKIIKEDK